jgi:hypothetical protein
MRDDFQQLRQEFNALAADHDHENDLRGAAQNAAVQRFEQIFNARLGTSHGDCHLLVGNYPSCS